MKNSNQIEDIIQKVENGVSGDLSGKESVWGKVEQKLNKTQEKKKVIPFPVWKLSGIAASLLLLVGMGYFIWDKQNNPVIMDHSLPPIVNVDNSDSENNSFNQVQDLENEIDASESNETQIVKKKVAQSTKNDLKNNESQQQIVSNIQNIEPEGVLINEEIVLHEINLGQTETDVKSNPQSEKN